jgi:hypothetical protein
MADTNNKHGVRDPQRAVAAPARRLFDHWAVQCSRFEYSILVDLMS